MLGTSVIQTVGRVMLAANLYYEPGVTVAPSRASTAVGTWVPSLAPLGTTAVLYALWLLHGRKWKHAQVVVGCALRRDCVGARRQSALRLCGVPQEDCMGIL